MDFHTVSEQIRAKFPADSKFVFVSGNFNILHPGHLRLLKFASELSRVLLVGVISDQYSKNRIVDENLRIETIRSLEMVDEAFLLDGHVDDFIKQFKPDYVVKGKEFESSLNSEKGIVESYGGELIFASGEVTFSSSDMINQETKTKRKLKKADDYIARHAITETVLRGVLNDFSKMRVVVFGDMIVDEYINCESLGMSQEDPTIVVRPLDSKLFVGGAGVVAAHAQSLGAHVDFFSVVGGDPTATFARDELSKIGVHHHFLKDHTRPTTLKQRFRASGKTLLRVSTLRSHEITSEQAEEVFESAKPILERANLILFSDFSHGFITDRLVAWVTELGLSQKIVMAADSQSSSQLGDISRFKKMDFVAATEREARWSMKDFASGLVVLAERLRTTTESEFVALKLGAEGLILHCPHGNGSHKHYTDQIPALNTSPKDVAGAGDSLFATTGLAYALTRNPWISVYMGSLAAGCQVGRVGNSPLKASDLLEEF